jgi:hypothetical protein
VKYDAKTEGLPTEEVLRELVSRARAEGADRIVIETTHEAGDAWIRAGFAELARVLEAPVEELERHLGARKEPSFGSIHVQSPGCPAARRAASCFRPPMGGRPRTTSCVTASRRCSGGWPRRSPIAWARSF